MSSPSEQQIYIGVWTNWSRGKIFGSTLTLPQFEGNLLIAFLAIFVSFAGSSLWRNLGYLLHRYFSSKVAQDGIYHQRQAILRNSASATGALWELTHLLWNWRRASYFRILPPWLLAAASAATLAVASIFSSKIATLAGSEVLLSGYSCGFPNATTTEDRQRIWYPYLSQRMSSAMDYSQRCYTNDARTQQSCNSFAALRISSTITYNASCPFQAEMCLAQNENILLDTGLIDSHQHLGFNAPLSKRLQFRSIIHCAPLTSTNFTGTYQSPDETIRVSYRTYFYGPQRVRAGANFTHMQPEMPPEQLKVQTSRTTFGDYEISVLPAYTVRSQLDANYSSFWPIPPLRRDNADTILFFLSANTVSFSQPVDDPWYSAHQPLLGFTHVTSEGESSTYMTDSPANVLGCTSQYQQCLPSLPENTRCSPLGGLLDTAQAISTDNQWQQHMRTWLRAAYSKSSIVDLVESLQVGSLASRRTMWGSQQGPLPKNQWQLDVEQWHHASLAAMQSMPVDMAAGPTLNSMRKIWSPPPNDAAKYFCRNQKVRSTLHLNFSVFALASTFLLGGMIIIANYALPPFVHSMEKKRNGYASSEWYTTGTLQLQRLAHEGIGYGTWSGCDGEVPLANSSALLANLDLRDPTHPILELHYPPVPELKPSDQRTGYPGSGAIDGSAQVLADHSSDLNMGYDENMLEEHNGEPSVEPGVVAQSNVSTRVQVPS